MPPIAYGSAAGAGFLPGFLILLAGALLLFLAPKAAARWPAHGKALRVAMQAVGGVLLAWGLLVGFAAFSSLGD